MAQTIVTFCDPHLVEEVEVPGLPYRVGINLPGEKRWGWFEVDLCPDHAKILTDLSLTLTEYGRPFRPEVTPPPTSTPTPAGIAGPGVCPECGQVFKPMGLGVHRRRIHGITGTRH